MADRQSHLTDFETRKSLHINLTSETHAALRMICFQHRLSMQEVFEDLAIQIIEEQPYMLDTLISIADKKKRKAVSKMSSTDAESIFKAIEDSNPLSSGEED